MSRPAMPASEHEPFPVRHVAHVAPRPAGQAWLVEQLFGLGAVGFAAGAPKLGKTWVCCELALAVATGTPALGRFAVPRAGNVLFYGAEDDQPSLRARFEGIARARGLRLEDAPLFLLDVAALRLDDAKDVVRLRATVAQQKPVLVVLDPFVRISRADENSASEVSAVLGELRAIQREFGTAILVAHHMRKSASGHRGYQLRGSGDFAAWHDSALYLSGSPDDLMLHVEHRGAPAPVPFRMRLATGDSPHLEIQGAESATTTTAIKTDDAVQTAILDRLVAAPQPVSTAELRRHLQARNQTVTNALATLERTARIRRGEGGWTVPGESGRERSPDRAILSPAPASDAHPSLFPNLHP